MKLSECTIGTFVQRTNEISKLPVIGYVVDIVYNYDVEHIKGFDTEHAKSIVEVIPIIKWCNEEIPTKIHPINLKLFKD